MVFQSYAVFPHMKVYDNVAFGLRMQKETEGDDRRAGRASSAELLHIEELLDRYPAQLSRRPAPARRGRPGDRDEADVLLMDEPLSNLDALLRLEMRAELKTLLQTLDATTIYVTHDQVEALSMGDRIAVMNEGRIVQVDKPARGVRQPGRHVRRRLHRQPADELPRGRGGRERQRERRRRELSGGSLPLTGETARSRGRTLLGIRAEAIGVETAPADGLVRATVSCSSRSALTTS